MAPISPGQPAGPPRKPKKPTATTKNHRFEPFSKRIARLKIDPVHRIDKSRPVDQDLSLSESHFRAAFEHWIDLNQSETYRYFSRQIRPKSESLPQVLYHADTIFDSLVSAIEKKDEHALEPLLNLMEAFAHDLGEHFEKYFADSVTLVLQVAASHIAPDVIEWCFKCLAWMFRFLSRLLVPDLRPLLAIMRPYLGLEKQKAYITRFAAESLAFLLRNAAMKHQTTPGYLGLAIHCLLSGLGQRVDKLADNESYHVGLMTLFSETAMGIDGHVHRSAPALISSIIQDMLAGGSLVEQERDVLHGTIINLLHQTSAAGFQPIFELVESAVMRITTDSPELETRVLSLLLHLFVGTRQGTRITDWSKVMKLVLRLSSVDCGAFSETEDLLRERLTTIAMTLQYAPIDQLLPYAQRLLHSAKDQSGSAHFFAFCDIFAQMGIDRFRGLLLPNLQKDVLSRWEDGEAGLLLLLCRLPKYGASSIKFGIISSISCPRAWESRILRLSGDLASSSNDNFDIKMDGFMQLLDVAQFPRDETVKNDLQKILHTLIEYGLRNPEITTNAKARFALGRGFQTYLRLSQSPREIDQSLWELICKLQPQAFSLPPFLHGLRWYAEQTLPSRPLINFEQDHIRSCLRNNLATQVVNLKLLSLQLMKDVFSSNDDWLRIALDHLIDILETPYTLNSERKLMFQLHEIPRLQKKCFSMATWGLLLPTFCMGLLSHYHSSPLRELCSAIGEMCSDQQVEALVVDTCINWLQTDGASPRLTEDVDNYEPELKYSAFQCSNVLSIDLMSQTTWKDYSDAETMVASKFWKDHQIHVGKVPPSSRNVALQLLLQIPDIAEKRSRLLVPVFLAVHMAQKRLVASLDASASVSSHTLSPEVGEQAWSYPDRKLFLELFGKFTNPGVLYRSTEVHEAVLDLLSSGNSEIQQAALRALLTWRNSDIQPYEDTLLRLVDGKADSGELDQLLHHESEKCSIEAEHRAGLMPVLLRIVFGLMTSHSKSQGPQEGKRKAILRKLFNLSHEEIVIFLDVVCGPLTSLYPADDVATPRLPTDFDIVPTDQQFGFVRTMHTMLNVLRTQMCPFGERVVPALLYCLARACRQINDITKYAEDQPHLKSTTIMRNIRKSSLDCLTMMFEYCVDLDWTPYVPIIFTEVITPRLSALPIETAQGISSLLRLFSIWSTSEKTLVLLKRDPHVITSVINCLAVPSAKAAVKLFVLKDIISNVVKLTQDGSKGASESTNIIRANIEPLLGNLNLILANGPSRDLLEAIVDLLPVLALFASESNTVQALLSSLSVVLGGSNKLNPRIKGGLLKAVQYLLQDHYAQIDQGILVQVYDLSCSFFNYFKDDANRETLCAVIKTYAQFDDELGIVHKICFDLNRREHHGPSPRTTTPNWDAQLAKKSKRARLDDVTFDQQIAAFAVINDLDISTVTAHGWKPILYNLIYLSRTEDDLSVRLNAVSCLRSFILRASQQQSENLDTLIQETLLPAFEKGVREKSEIIRADFVAMFGVLVDCSSSVPELQEMRALLVGGDSEASFYDNILHIQQHRRLRAMRRLVSVAEAGILRPKNISRFLLPLLESFVFDTSEDENTLTQKGQAIVTLSSLLRYIEWPNFKVTLRRYRGLMDSKVFKDRDVMKLLNGAIEALSTATREKLAPTAETSTLSCSLASSLPSDEIISTELKSQLIPKLTVYLRHSDETKASLRLPASVVSIKTILLLPPEEAAYLIPSILLHVCNILRSRDQQIRDETRNVLAEISSLLGPRYLHLMVRELRTALSQDYQMHVLTYTVHRIVLSMTPQMHPGELDYCLPELSSLLMDDIFGFAGSDKDNDNYVSSMKEFRGNKKNSKSFGIMEALASVCSVRKVSVLLEPLRVLLNGTLRSKQQQHADEVLRRIGVGLILNPAAGTRDTLIFSYELIRDLYNAEKSPTLQLATTNDKNRKQYLIQTASNPKMSNGVNSSGLYKMHRFALDLVRSTLQRHQQLLTAENLHGFLPIVGDALTGQQGDVKVSALRLLSAMIRLPLPELDESAALYIKEAVEVVENSSNTNSDGPQAALKLVASILRERPSVDVRRSDLEYLLHKVIPDLEEPDRQGSSFSLIKAVMAREVKAQAFELPEMYEMADKISIMMVSNQSKSARDIARGVYVHFLIEFPQTKKRWDKQLKFLAENLGYQYPEGRESVMEAINVLVTKLGSERAQEPISWFFLPVMLRLANDETKSCREMAGALLTRLFARADTTELSKMLSSVREWVAQDDEPALFVTGMQAYEYFLEALGPQKEANHIRSAIEKVILTDAEDVRTDVELHQKALELFLKLVSVAPATMMTPKQAGLWSAVRGLLTNVNTGVQSTAASLVSIWFQDVATANAKPDFNLHKVPLLGNHGLPLNKSTMMDLMKSSLRTLRRLDATSTDLGLATVRNLVFLASCFDANKANIDISSKASADSEIDTGPPEEDQETTEKIKIPVVQYLLHQLAAIVRRESESLTSTALQPKKLTLELLLGLVPQLSMSVLTQESLTTLLTPLRHLTSSELAIPKSSDPTFEATYTSLITSALEVIEALHTKVQDTAYVKAMTQVNREVRDRRENRRKKRRIGAVVDPERNAVRKKVKNERKTARKKEVAHVHRNRRSLV